MYPGLENRPGCQKDSGCRAVSRFGVDFGLRRWCFSTVGIGVKGRVANVRRF